MKQNEKKKEKTKIRQFTVHSVYRCIDEIYFTKNIFELIELNKMKKRRRKKN